MILDRWRVIFLFVFVIAGGLVTMTALASSEATKPEATKPDAQATPDPAASKADPHTAPDAAKEGDVEPAKPLGPSRKYNPGAVQPFPAEITGKDVLTGRDATYKVTPGRGTIVVFIASWCEPCQQIMPQLKQVTSRYSSLYTDVVFIFAHDTVEDARGFAKEHKLSGNLFVATHDILKTFKNPMIPAVYVGDRYNYMGHRFIKMTAKDTLELDSYLAKINSL